MGFSDTIFFPYGAIVSKCGPLMKITVHTPYRIQVTENLPLVFHFVCGQGGRGDHKKPLKQTFVPLGRFFMESGYFSVPFHVVETILRISGWFPRIRVGFARIEKREEISPKSLNRMSKKTVHNS